MLPAVGVPDAKTTTSPPLLPYNITVPADGAGKFVGEMTTVTAVVLYWHTFAAILLIVVVVTSPFTCIT
jgi:hypothetical protein